jgi:hypothetical protein
MKRLIKKLMIMTCEIVFGISKKIYSAKVGIDRPVSVIKYSNLAAWVTHISKVSVARTNKYDFTISSVK